MHDSRTLNTLSLVSTLFIASGASVSADERGFVVTQNNGQLNVAEQGHPVLSYQLAPKSLDGRFTRAHYVHPLYRLDGAVLTEDFPEDHRHHRGIFWAWHQVLVGDKTAGDQWLCRDFNWDVHVSAIDVSATAVCVDALAIWSSPQLIGEGGKPIPIAEDRLKLTIHPREDKRRVLDFDISLRALVPNVRIGGSNDAKGYGGFSPRIALNRGLAFFGEQGLVEPQMTATHAGPWVSISEDRIGIATITHPDNPPPHGQWILRRVRSMQNAVYPGREPVDLSQTTPTRLRYRVVLYEDLEMAAATVMLNNEARRFAGD